MLVVALQIGLMLVAGLALGWAARRAGLPGLVGEMAAGLLLGPSVLGALRPGLTEQLFPAHGPSADARSGVIQVGLLVFLFEVGTRLDVVRLDRLGARILWTSAGGILLPFALGYAAVQSFPGVWGVAGASDVTGTALLVATALSISALPVIARILGDLGLLASDAGVVVMAAATLDDIAGWSIFAVILSRFGGGTGSPALSIASVVGLLAAALLIGRAGSGRRVLGRLPRPAAAVASIALALGLARITQAIGLGGIFGAFLAGILLARGTSAESPSDRLLEKAAALVCAPLYFVSVGMQVDLTRDFDAAHVLVTIAVATVGKVAGAAAGARLGGAAPREAAAVGFGLNARGAMGVIFASTALQHGLLPRPAFVAIVAMALATSVVSGPAMKRLLAAPR